MANKKTTTKTKTKSNTKAKNIESVQKVSTVMEINPIPDGTQSVCNTPKNFSIKFWADDYVNAYLGDCEKVDRLVGLNSLPTMTTSQGSATCCEYLYFVAWSNDGGQNAFIAEINGGNKVLTGDNSKWEVFPTGIDKDPGSPSPTIEEINEQLEKAKCGCWKKVFVGPKRNDTVAENIFNNRVQITNGMDGNARYIWYDSETDSNTKYPYPSYVPFRGHNHDEFLIFRVPVKSFFKQQCSSCKCKECNCNCGCGCSGCNKDAKKQNTELFNRAQKKYSKLPFVDTPSDNESCNRLVHNPDMKLQPYFYLHYLDGSNDQIEEHDTEVFYITICNPFKDAKYNGLRITKVTLVPDIGNINKIQIVPDRLVSLDCLEPCSCQTREFALITRDLNISGTYSLEVEYCFENITIVNEFKGGKSVYKPLKITED